MDPENTGIITGEKARSTFEKSGLPPPILGEIWQLADQESLGFLSQFGFCHAMRLIGYTQAGQHPTATIADTPGPLPKFVSLQQLQPQSTSSSFMQSQPTSLVPQNTTTLQSKPQDPISSISPADYQRFSQLFIKTTGSPTGELGGAQAREILLKAKLPTATLGQIWSLVDRHNSGKLNLDAFVIAMHLIQSLLGNQINQLPPFLPQGIWQSVGSSSRQTSGYTSTSRQPSHSSVSSQQTTVRHTRDSFVPAPTSEWIVTPTMRQQYDSIFNNLDKNKTGELNPEQVASFLMTSKLNQQDLASVWDLADIQNSGIFTKLEFSIALVLVNKKLSGGELPNVVPDELVQSLHATEESAQQQAHQQQATQQQATQQQAPQQPQQPQQQPQPQPSQVQPAVTKSTLDDLVDIFGIEQPPRPTQERTLSSSDLSQELPKVRSNLTTSFTPTSNFGQTLVNKSQVVPVKEEAPVAPAPHPVSPRLTSSASLQIASPELRAINYDALRTVPPPPPKKTLTPYPQQPTLEDLLADPTSGQLSQANSDIANVSNQIKSLATQTTGLHEKKVRAEQELQRILTVKQEIETKLRSLRALYENEVKLVDQVENNLATAKEETEALRSEASISEAKFNSLSFELGEKQLAMESLQKENGTLKEKLGVLNAEIVELESQVAIKANESQQLNNQVSVKRSQVQVSLVKSQELKQTLSELENSNLQFHQELQQGHEEHLRLEQEHEELISSHAAEQQKKQQLHQEQALLFQKQLQLQLQTRDHDLQKQRNFEVQLKKDLELKKQQEIELKKQQQHDLKQKEFEATKQKHESSISGSGIAAGVAGAVVAGVAGVAAGAAAIGHALSANHKESKTEATSEKVPEIEPTSGDHNEIAIKPVGIQDASEHTHLPESDIQENNLPSEIPEDEAERYVNHDQLPDADRLPIHVQDKSVLPQFSSYTSRTDTTTSSVVTNQDNETPVTSPSTSDFQFPQNTNIAGGLVGMPGVLVGVQRTESLTSSVQNNAALSVRDDNIEVSDRETLGNDDEDEEKDVPKLPGAFGVPAVPADIDGDKSSSGVESFEIVNADEARDEEHKNLGQSEHKSLGQIEEEFPPIKELDYDDGDSTAESSNEDNFDDAVDNLTARPKEIAETKKADFAPPSFDFDNEFDDLTPATPEANSNDLFGGDEFEGLEEAREENIGYEFTQPEDDDEFGFTDGFSSKATNADLPDFDAPAHEEPGSDEWEQLFAGFGNAGAASEAPEHESVPSYAVPSSVPFSGDSIPSTGGATLTTGGAPAIPSAEAHTTPQPSGSVLDDLVDELVGMGFSKQVAFNALQKEHWDLQAATNFLLDNA